MKKKRERRRIERWKTRSTQYFKWRIKLYALVLRNSDCHDDRRYDDVTIWDTSRYIRMLACLPSHYKSIKFSGYQPSWHAEKNGFKSGSITTCVILFFLRFCFYYYSSCWFSWSLALWMKWNEISNHLWSFWLNDKHTRTRTHRHTCTRSEKKIKCVEIIHIRVLSGVFCYIAR